MNQWKKLKDKLTNGDTVSIVFLGGSITQGVGASDRDHSYVSLVSRSLKNKWPTVDFRIINSGIGGTNSLFGIGRTREDVLQYNPDLVIVDFCVNDHDEPFFAATYESLMAKLLGHASKPAVLALSNIEYDTGIQARNMHKPVLDRYHIPEVSMKELVYDSIAAGNGTWQDVSADGIHPGDTGHALIAWSIIQKLNDLIESSKTEAIEIPEPAAYTSLERFDNRNLKAELEDFQKDTHSKASFDDFFINGWVSNKDQGSLKFRLPFSKLIMQYKKTIHRPAPMADVWIDGEKCALLNANFEKDWGDCLYMQPVAEFGEKKEHQVEIRLRKSPECQSDFYLLSVLADEDPDTPVNQDKDINDQEDDC